MEKKKNYTFTFELTKDCEDNIKFGIETDLERDGDANVYVNAEGCLLNEIYDQIDKFAHSIAYDIIEYYAKQFEEKMKEK